MKLSLFLHGLPGDTPERVRQLADEVVADESNAPLHWRQSFLQCSGDWILALPAGREPGAQLNRGILERLMSARAVTHYYFPERFLLDPHHYAATAPYVGRFALSLWRNIESIAVVPADPSQGLVVAGEPAYLASFYLDSPAAHPAPDVESLPVEDVADVKVMAPMNGATSKAGVHVRFIRIPAAMSAGRTYWATIRISNNGLRALLPQSEFVYAGNLALTYRWFNADGSGVSAAQGARAPFPARILPGYEHDALITIRAPESAGPFGLQADIVEEDDRYFSACEKGSYEIRSIEVRARG